MADHTLGDKIAESISQMKQVCRSAICSSPEYIDIDAPLNLAVYSSWNVYRCRRLRLYI